MSIAAFSMSETAIAAQPGGSTARTPFYRTTTAKSDPAAQPEPR